MSTKKLQIVNRMITTDETLTQSGAVADAKATGDAITSLNTLVGDTAVATQISDAIAVIVPESIGALNQENYYGIVRKEGEVVAAESLEGLAIGVTTFVEPIVEGTPDVATDSVATITPVETVTVTRTGTNIIDTKNCVYCQNWGSSNPIVLERTETGFKLTTNTDRENSWIRMMAYIGTREELAGRTITLSADYASSAEHANNRANKAIVLSDTYGGYNASETTVLGQVQGANSLTVTIPNEGTKYVYAMLYLGYGYTAPAGSTVEWSNIRVNIGDKDLGYEPYNGQVLTMTLPEAIYGGELNWTAGELIVTRAAYVVTGEENWTWNGSGNNQRFDASVTGVPQPANLNASSFDVLCTHHKTATGANRAGVWVTNYGNLALRFREDNGVNGIKFGGNLETFVAYLKEQYAAGTPVTYIYTLRYPYTIQLSPQELLAIDGTNTVWSHPGTTCADFNCTPFLKAIRPIIAITDEEIDSICETLWEGDDGVLVDEVTGRNYKLYVNNGDLKMTEVN